MATPDETALRFHLESPEFKLGEADGRWRRLAEITWPFVFIAVTARDGVEYPFRFDCSGFPHQGATGGPWDVEKNMKLANDRWPQSKSKDSGIGRVAAVFRVDWQAGLALYLPCDRISVVGHNDWLSQLRSKVWDPKRGLVHYLEQIHELLNCSDYASLALAAS